MNAYDSDSSESSSDDGYDEDRPMLAGGRDGMADGEDFLQGRKKMYVVGRGRTKTYVVREAGPLDFRFLMPLPARNVYEQFEDVMSRAEFAERWLRAYRSSFDVEPNVLSDEHDKMQGPGRFAFDIRVMKYMPPKRKPGDLNGNTTLAVALAKLRSLHTTLVKAFGGQWTNMIRASAQNIPAIDRYINNLNQAVVYSDPFLAFSPEDLQFRYGLFEPVEDAGPQPGGIRRKMVELRYENRKIGLVYGFFKEQGGLTWLSEDNEDDWLPIAGPGRTITYAPRERDGRLNLEPNSTILIADLTRVGE